MTHVFILQQHPLLPDELEDRDEARGDHPAHEHDEHATQVRQAKLTTRFGTAALKKGKKQGGGIQFQRKRETEKIYRHKIYSQREKNSKIHAHICLMRITGIII